MTSPNEPLIDRRGLIKARHLHRHAVVYVRQSSPGQVRENTGSTAVQRALRERARQLGWTESLIKVIDEDLGLSGTTSYQRAGFKQLRELIQRDEVGLVLVQDVSRLSRNPQDAEEFLTLAIRAELLIEANGHLFEAHDQNLAELFGFRIKSLLAWWDNASRGLSLRLGKEAKISQGRAVTRPPIGYVWATQGQWALDPTAEVREVVRRVFELYTKLRSIRQVARYFESHHLRFPRRAKGELRWQPVTVAQIARLLKNPQYVGDYVFRRVRVIRATETTKRLVLRRPSDEWLVRSDHHEPYVGRETWHQIQKTLAGGRISNRQPVRDGAALLQSCLWCGNCDRPVYTKYQNKTHDKHLPTYVCVHRDRLGTDHHCFSVSAAFLDAAVVERVLASVTLPGIEDAMVATQAAILEQERLNETQFRLLQQAEYEVDQATRRWLLVELENKAVQKVAQADLETKTQDRDRLRCAIDEQMSNHRVVLTKDDAAELVHLSQNIGTLWTASTTKNSDRKHLLRTLIARVVVKVTDEWIDVDLVWNGGAREEFRLLRSKGLDDRIAELRAAGATEAQIEMRLCDDGITNRFGRPVSRPVIWRRLTKMGMNTKVARLPALRRVRELAIAGRTRPEMLVELNEHGPRHRRGAWTRHRLESALRALCLGRASGIDPLPPEFSVAVEVWTSDQVIERIVQGRNAGRPWRSILDDLDAEGFRPLKAPAFSTKQAMALFRRAERRALIPIRRLRHRQPRSAPRSNLGRTTQPDLELPFEGGHQKN